MPCGGIYPIKGHALSRYHKPEHPCLECGKGDCDLFCEEWDSVLHSACVESFLKGDEGQVVLNHKHGVIILKDGELVELHEGD